MILSHFRIFLNNLQIDKGGELRTPVLRFRHARGCFSCRPDIPRKGKTIQIIF